MAGNMLGEPPANSTRAKTGPGNTSRKAKRQSSRKLPADLSDNEDVDVRASVKTLDAAKPRKAKVTSEDAHTTPSKIDGHPVKIEKTHPGGDRVEAEPEELGKRKKRKSMKAKDNDGISTEQAPPKSKLGRPRKADKVADAASAKDFSNMTSTVDPPSSRGKPSKVKKSQEGERTAGEGASVDTTQMSVFASKRSKKPDAPSKGSGETTNMTEVPPGTAIDDSVFDALLAKDQGTQQIEEAPIAKESESTKATEKPTKDERSAGSSTKDNSKTDKKVQDRSKKTDKATGSLSKGRKRKAIAGSDEAVVKPNVFDPLSNRSAMKKQKKSQAGAFDTVGSMLGSSIDGAKKRAKAVIDYAGDVVGSARKSIMSDVTGEAEVAVDEKTLKKPKTSSTGQNPTYDHGEEDEVDETDLLKGFESSDDERDGEDVGYDEGKDVPAIEKAKLQKIKGIQRSAAQGPGFIYIGRVPHGFYEHQMRAYFGQFGNISRLRLSRNKTTGRSKHFGFIEFESEEVAKIVAQTMDNYLLFGHILKVKLIPEEQLHPDTFKGANKRFKQIPWAQIEGRKLAMPAGRERWGKRVEAEEKKRQKKAEQMKQIGYGIDAPLKSVDQVPIQESKKAIENARLAEEETLITGGDDKGGMIVVSEVTKKRKKPKATIEEVEGNKDAEAPTVSKGKRKAEDGLEKAQDMIEEAAGPLAKKVKKAKIVTDTITDTTVKKVKNVKNNAVEHLAEAEDPATTKAKRSKKTDRSTNTSDKALKATAKATGRSRKDKD